MHCSECYECAPVLLVLYSDTDPQGGGVLPVGGGHSVHLLCETKLSRFCCSDIVAINRHFDNYLVKVLPGEVLPGEFLDRRVF